VIDKGPDGEPEIHYSCIYKQYAHWSRDGSIEKIFEGSVKRLFDKKMLNISILHGDGTNTVSKKGGGYWLLGSQTSAW